jgi:hypothetical protein
MTTLPEDVARPELADVLETARLVLTHVSGDGAHWRADLKAAGRRAEAAAASASPALGSDDSDYRED